MEKYSEIKTKISAAGLKVTPQRVAVYEAVINLNHPSADQIQAHVKQNHPGISTGAVYHILESFAENGLLVRVKTGKGVMRYDAVLEKHHHLYCEECDKITDYYDPELDALLDNYFKSKTIDRFSVKDIKLQIVGTFNHNK
ncbi:MAG: transcriptional repressor [Bacteroidetes bacterium]|nr:transcriptional repressor [Bacteroidota bacterium]